MASLPDKRTRRLWIARVMYWGGWVSWPYIQIKYGPREDPMILALSMAAIIFSAYCALEVAEDKHPDVD